jgi:sulfur transfer protein SufE
MYKITKEQKDSIINAFFEINSPVKLYSQVVEMLNKLPEIKEEACCTATDEEVK